LLTATLLQAQQARRKRRGEKRLRRWAVHPLNKLRGERGLYHQLVQELFHDEAKFKDFFRLTIEQFNYVLSKIEDLIEKKKTRDSIFPKERLAIFLHHPSLL
jgi:hypothetical protein